MRFIIALFTVAVLIVSAVFVVVDMHRFAVSADREMFSIAVLAFMVALASLGAILETGTHSQS